MKPFGKLSPDDKLSASLMPMLFDRPHKVLEKLRIAKSKEPQKESIDIKIQERMDMGNVLEETIIQLIAKRLNVVINYPIDEVMSIEIGKIKKKPLDLYASLDGMIYATQSKLIAAEDRRIYVEGEQSIELLGPVPVEIKNMQYKPYDSIECMTVQHGRGYLQLQAQMLIADAKFGIIGCLFNGNDLRVFIVKQNKDIQAEILSRALTLYKHLEMDTDYSPSDLETMADKYAEVKTPSIDLPAEALITVNNYEDCLNERKKLDGQIETLQMKLIETLGDSEEGMIHYNGGMTKLSRPYRHYKAQPAKYVEAKEARQVRAKSVTIKHILEGWD